MVSADSYELPSALKKIVTYKLQISEHLSLIDTLSLKRFANPLLAEEAVVYVLEKLQEDQGKRLAGYAGVSRFSTYLSAVVMRLFEDFSRQRFGRLRPPVWLARLGGLWLVAFKLLCMERKSFPEVVDEMIGYHNLSSQTAEHMSTTILAEVIDCGHRHGQTLSMEDAGSYRDVNGTGVSQGLEEKERVILCRALFHKVLGDDVSAETKLFDLDFNLSGQEKVLLKLCYQDGMNVSRAGQMVGLTPHQTHGKMRRLLGRIRRILNESGAASSLKPFLMDE